jgi:hypothetical protein
MRLTALFGCLTVGMFLLMAENGQAQNNNSDSTRTKIGYKPANTTVNDSSNTGDVLVLDSIEIRGRVQKPGVLLVPKRVAPEMGKMELNRSFDQELKAAGDIPKVDKELRKVERVKSVKKAVEKKRK